MKTLLILLFFLKNFCISGQELVYEYDYKGRFGMGEKAINEVIIPTKPNTIYEFVFCTSSVPDELIVYKEIDSIKFYLGSSNKPNYPKNIYKGYCEFSWLEKELKTLLVESNKCCLCGGGDDNIGGSMKLLFKTEGCELKFTTKAFPQSPAGSIYNLKIYKIQEGALEVVDTISFPSCKEEITYYEQEGCSLIKYQPLNFSIQNIKYHLIPPTCFGKEDGKLLFLDSLYYSYNKYNLSDGNYNFEIENKYCKGNIEFNFKTEFCKDGSSYYIPNIIKPLSENNNTFTIFSPLNVEYKIKIYNRFGAEIFDSYFMTNEGGWKGEGAQQGVYMYIIHFNDHIFTGDITII